MRQASLAEFLLMRLERRGALPLNRQIYQAIREAILGAMLPAGLQLPSTRELAQQLSVARNTIKYAYEQLTAEGYLESLTGAGTYVANTAPEFVRKRTKGALIETKIDIDSAGPSALSQRGAQLIARAGASDVQWGAFVPGVPDVQSFPVKIWKRLQNKHWQRSQAQLLTYGQAGGYMPLRQAIVDYLGVARGVNCVAAQVIITAGTHQSLDVVVKLLGESGDTAWVEDPCYWGTRSVLESTGIETVAMAVDQEGIRIQDGQQVPRFICVTPSHQYPLGMVLSLARRRALLDYAAAQQSWIIEDDYDSEFRYGSRPLAALQGMDRNGRVIYMGSFSKTLFPGLRISFLVVPEALAQPVSIGVSELYRGGQVFLQAVLADFMLEGHFVAHIRRMRILYAQRLELLQTAIRTHFGAALRSTAEEAGLQLVLHLPPECDDVLLSRAARAAGIVARPLSAYYAQQEGAPKGLLLGYACVAQEAIAPAFATLAAIIGAHCPLPAPAP